MSFDRSRYHPNFPKRSRLCIKRAKYTCQECGRKKGDPYITKRGKPSKVVLQAHHPNYDRMNARAKLVALCKQCHLAADKEYRARQCHNTYRRKEKELQMAAGQLELSLFRRRRA